jgi:RNA polymerase sigma factor (sigma-70 family)
MSEIVAAAGDGDPGAWRWLVEHHRDVVWSVARAHTLSDADAADVAQATWLSLARHVRRLRDPGRLAGWLATTARRESLRILATRGREVPLGTVESVVDGPEALALRDESRAALWRALRAMPTPCRTLLRLMADSPGMSYADAAKALGIRASSVGPIRGRCLARLRRTLEREDQPR